MSAFEYERATSVEGAVASVAGDPEATFLAGGTTQLDLQLKDAIVSPKRLVDVTRLPLRGIEHREGSILVGSLTTMEELAADAVVRERLPFVREAAPEDGLVRLYVDRGEVAVPQLLRVLDGEGLTAQSISLHRPSLDDVFLRQTGRSLRDEPAA